MVNYKKIGINEQEGWYLNDDGDLCLRANDGTLLARYDSTGLEYTVARERTIQLYPGALLPGATDPTQTTAIGTFTGWAFDNDNESKHFGPVIVPADWDGASDMTLDLYWVPESGAAIADTKTVKWDGTWRVKAAGGVVDAATVGSMTTTYTQSGAGTDKELIKTSLAVDYDDTNQPIVASSLLSILLDRDMTTDTYASDANLVAAALRYTTTSGLVV